MTLIARVFTYREPIVYVKVSFTRKLIDSASKKKYNSNVFFSFEQSEIMNTIIKFNAIL